MKLLIVTAVDAWTRSVSTLHHFVAAGRRQGHDVAVYGAPDPQLPGLSFSTDLNDLDLALFVVQIPSDFPDMPDLARILDTIPRERRAVVDLWGRFNDTIRIEHDFNHLEKLDGHLGWEWIEAMAATSDLVLQPTLSPLRPGVHSFLFHGFEPRAVVDPGTSSAEAARRWRDGRSHGLMYAGSNWQRWTDIRRLLEAYAPLRREAGPACLVGWDWGERPQWAIEKGIMGVDTDAALLASLDVEVRDGVRFDEIVGLLGQARFVPVCHRPLFRHLGLVTARSFETFHADTLPVMLLPPAFVEAIYGPAALALTPGDDITGHLERALTEPERVWQAVYETRAHLARHHSYERRYEQLAALAARPAPAGAA